MIHISTKQYITLRWFASESTNNDIYGISYLKPGYIIITCGYPKLKLINYPKYIPFFNSCWNYLTFNPKFLYIGENVMYPLSTYK